MRWLPRDPTLRSALVAGLGTAAFTALAFGMKSVAGAWSANVADPPAPPAPPPHAPPPAKLEWATLSLAGNQVQLAPNVRYRGCVRLPWYAPKSAVRGKLQAGVEAKGFRDVVIVERVTGTWPNVECDFYVEATWGKPLQTLDVPSAVELAWWGRWV